MLNAPAAAVTVVQQNGWMNSDIFVACLKVFLSCSAIARKYSSDSRWLQ